MRLAAARMTLHYHRRCAPPRTVTNRTVPPINQSMPIDQPSLPPPRAQTRNVEMGFFSMGMLAHTLRDRIRLNGWIVSAGFVACLILRNTVCYEPLFTIWLPYACLWVAYTPRINAHQFGFKGDFSYGIYIFAYPVQQWLYSMNVEMYPLTNAILTFFIVIVLAACSFWYIEKPALGMKHTVALRIRSVFRLNKSTE